MDDQRTQVAGLFDRTAETYDAVGVDFFKPIARRLVGEVAPRPGERALDIGCGRGAVLFALAEAVGTEGRVTAIDLAPRMVEATARDAAAAGIEAEVRIGDAQEPALPAASFDIVASSLVLFFLPDPGAALGAWRGLLVDGGRVGVSTFGPYTTEWKAVDAVFEPYTKGPIADPRTRKEGAPFGSDEGVASLFRDAGFDDVRTVTDTVSVRFDDEDQWHRWTWSVGQRRMWEAVPETERDALRASAYDALQQTRDHHGRIGFDQVVRYTLATR